MAGRAAARTASPRPDQLPCLIADAEPAVLARTVLAVAAMHEPDEQGRCRVCTPRRPWWRRWSRDRGGACPTRRVLWSTLVGEGGAGLTSVTGASAEGRAGRVDGGDPAGAGSPLAEAG